MGPLSGAIRRVGRIGVPIATVFAAVLAAVLLSAQGASAATVAPNHPVSPSPRCVLKHVTAPPPGTTKPTTKPTTRPTSGGGVVVTKPSGGQGHCVACGGEVTMGSGSVSVPDKGTATAKRGRCVVCVVRIKGSGKPGSGHGGSGQVTVSGSGSSTGTMRQDHGGKPPVGACPAPQVTSAS